MLGFRQNDRTASIVVERSGIRETYYAPHVVCALPFSVTGGLFEEARLSHHKHRLTEAYPYVPASKVFPRSTRARP